MKNLMKSLIEIVLYTNKNKMHDLNGGINQSQFTDCRNNGEDYSDALVVSCRTCVVRNFFVNFKCCNNNSIHKTHVLFVHYRCWNRNGVRLPHHRLRQEPLPQAAAFLIRHLGFRPVWGYGSVLSYDGVPAVVRFLSYLLLRTLLLPSHMTRFQWILSGVDGHGIECVETSPS